MDRLTKNRERKRKWQAENKTKRNDYQRKWRLGRRVSDEDIRRVMSEAEQAGDLVLVEQCRHALNGYTHDRAAVAAIVEGK